MPILRKTRPESRMHPLTPMKVLEAIHIEEMRKEGMEIPEPLSSAEHVEAAMG